MAKTINIHLTIAAKTQALNTVNALIELMAPDYHFRDSEELLRRNIGSLLHTSDILRANIEKDLNDVEN